MRFYISNKILLVIALLFVFNKLEAQLSCSYNYYSDSLNTTYYFSNVSGGATPYTYNWNFGNGITSNAANPIAQYNSPGAYGVSLTVTDTNGLRCTSYDTVFVNYCQAYFIYNINPQSNIVTFTNYSVAPQNGVSYNWDFGDGTPLFLGRNASHTYTNSGTYNVTLNLYDSSNNCSSFHTDSLNIVLPCRAGFNYSFSPGNPAAVSFTSTASNYNDIFYLFGDGASSSIANPTHIYNQSGSYIVTQRVRNGNCVNIYSDTLQVNIPQPCQSGFTYNINQTTVNITNRASNYNSLFYDFGDGSSSSSENPSHTYARSGNYTICQFVYGNNNCVDTTCINITVIEPCVADFAYALSDDTLSITDLSYLADSIRYEFGDGAISFNQNPTHIYGTSGKFTVCQYISNSFGCTDVRCDTINITLPKCEAKFSWSQQGDSIVFNNEAKNYNSIQYNFGDGNTSNIQNPVHIYAQSGQYIVKQTVLDVSRGCVDTFTDTLNITISTSCVASFQIAVDTNLRGTLFIVNTSSNDNSHQYLWTFGDGTSDSIRLPSHSYSQNKAHEICLTVYDSVLNCSSTFCDTVGLDSNGNLLKSKGYELKVLEGDFIGVNESQRIQASIFPNPFKDILHVQGLNLNIKTEFILRDINGRVLRHQRISKQTIELTTLLKGIYILEIRQNGASIIQKIIKQ